MIEYHSGIRQLNSSMDEDKLKFSSMERDIEFQIKARQTGEFKSKVRQFENVAGFTCTMHTHTHTSHLVLADVFR